MSTYDEWDKRMRALQERYRPQARATLGTSAQQREFAREFQGAWDPPDDVKLNNINNSKFKPDLDNGIFADAEHQRREQLLRSLQATQFSPQQGGFDAVVQKATNMIIAAEKQVERHREEKEHLVTQLANNTEFQKKTLQVLAALARAAGEDGLPPKQLVLDAEKLLEDTLLEMTEIELRHDPTNKPKTGTLSDFSTFAQMQRRAGQVPKPLVSAGTPYRGAAVHTTIIDELGKMK